MGRPAILKIDILADAKGVGKGVSEAEGKLGKLGGAAKGAGLAIGAGLAVGAVAVGAFAVQAVGAASQVEQSFGAVESVFGQAAAQVKGYANTAATELGLAKSEYASLAAVVGSQLQSMGQSQAQSATTSRELIGVGADLAATFGGSVSDAVGAVGSLLRGERDPIEKYGIAIKDADIKARLAANGQDKLTGAALKTATAQATLALLTEQSKNAHGAFGRESNTLAGQQERLRAQFENVKATVGAGLTPILTRLLTFVSGSLLPGAQRLADQLRTALGPAFDKVGAFVTKTVLPAFSQLTSNTNGPTKGALAGLATFVTGTVVPTAQRLAVFFTGTLVPALRTLAGFVTANVVPVLRALAGFVVGTLIPAVVRLATPVIGALRSGLATVGAAINSNRSQLATLGNAVLGVARVVGPLASVVGTVLAAAFRVAAGVIGGIIGVLGGVVRAAQAAASAIRTVANAAETVGSVVGKLNPFSAPLLNMGVPLTGGTPSYAPLGGLATAGLGGTDLASLAYAAPSGGGVTIVDRRSIDMRVTVQGALDPVSVARQLENVLRDQAVRLGRVSAYGTA